MIRRIVEDGKRGNPWHDVSFTISTTPNDGSQEVTRHKVIVPNWARKKLYRAIEELALSFGWDGVTCPKPTPQYPFR